MPARALALLVLFACETGESARQAPAAAFEIVPFTGSASNAYLLLGRKEALLIDAAHTRSDAARLGDAIAQSGRKLTTIFITHAHPDHLLGLAQLQERFPDAQAVSTAGVVEDVRRNQTALLSNAKHTLHEEAPRALAIPRALTGDRVQFDGITLQVIAFENGESAHAAALYDPASRTLFAGDLVFSNTHLYLREKRLDGWRAQLTKAEAWADEANVARVLPGHGPATDRTVFAENRRYIDDFAAALETRDAARIRQRMLARHPRHLLPQNLETSIRAFILMGQ